MTYKGKNLFSILLRNFDPATALWRTLELEQIYRSISKIDIQNPILDLGCGEGKIYRTIFNKQKFDIGLDNSFNMLKSARDSEVYRYVILADACHMPFLKESFNTVFSNSVIEHIKDLNSLLNEIINILKPSGLLIFTVPTDKFGEYLLFYRFFNKIGLKKIGDWYKSKRIELLNHYNLFDLDGWSNRLRKLGLEVVESRYYISRDILSAWDLIAALQFVWCKTIFWSQSLPFKKAFSPLFKFLYKKYENNSNGLTAGLVVVAKKRNNNG